MPNYAYNKITVVGDRETLDQFRKAVGIYGEEREVQEMNYQTKEVVRKMEKVVNVFDFEKIIPYPDGFEMFAEVEVDSFLVLGEKWKDPAWYVWNNENWGTKWNSFYAEVSDDGINLTFNFNTAWCYPGPIFDKIIKDWKTLTFYFKLTEESNAYDIEAKASNGEWNYFNNYLVANTGGYDDEGPEFYVLYRHNELTDAVETLAQKWFPGEIDYDEIEDWCETVKWRRMLSVSEGKALQIESSERARDIIAYSKRQQQMKEFREKR